jgi:hypothetical protein
LAVDIHLLEADGFKLVAISTDVSAMKGMFAARVKRPVSLEAMDVAIKGAVSERLTRSKG